MKLTETAVAKLKSNKSDEIFFDDALPRFGVRLREGGSKKYVIDYRQAGVQRRYTIGSASNMTLEEARQRARKVLTAVDDGKDPVATKAEQRVASGLFFLKVANEYLAARSSLRATTLAGYADNLLRQWKPLHGLALTGVSKAVIASHLRTIAKDSGPIAADRARATLSSMFAWAAGEGLCESNPVINTNVFGGKPRERVLSDAEIVKVWKAAPDNDYGRIVKLLLLTGQRRDEVGGLRWSEIDGGKKLITLSSSRTKNGRPHEVPLSGEALAILQGAIRHREDFVFGHGVSGFAGWSKCKLGLDSVCGVKGWTLHDLRRTCATGMANIGVLPHVIEAVLNHVSGHKAGVAGTYNLSVYAKEKREALNLWASHVRVIVAQAEGANVTKLARKA